MTCRGSVPGAKRRCLMHFGSARSVSRASVADLLGVEGYFRDRRPENLRPFSPRVELAMSLHHAPDPPNALTLLRLLAAPARRAAAGAGRPQER